MDGHIEEISCPSCQANQSANVQYTRPFWTYVHNCKCGHVITESEWETSENYKTALVAACKGAAANTAEKSGA